jgi:metal-responsive CopG/Arc/MetJ family transcriptional regulator
MSIQIAVRLPDDLVDALDTMVVESDESGRTSVIERALRRELRRYQAEQDAHILREKGDYDELAAFITRAQQSFPELD